jgi:hypothetical protein
MTPAEVATLMQAGREIVAAVLEPHGFAYRPGWSGTSSGGNSDSGEFVRGDRRLELHFRHSLGLVRYHIGDLSISHEDYMRHTGHRSQAKYPGFSPDPLDGFRHLADDLHNFCSDFTVGDGGTFVAAKKASESFAARSGLGKLSTSDP